MISVKMSVIGSVDANVTIKLIRISSSINHYNGGIMPNHPRS